MGDTGATIWRRSSSERGTTLSEVLIVLALSAIVAAPIYAVLQSGLRTERAQSQQLEVEAQLERVAVRLEDDVREGVPSARRAGEPATELAILRSETSGAQSVILWAVEGDELRRRSYDLSTGRLVTDVVLLEGLSGTSPVFRYWELGGGELAPNADLIYRCSERITVALEVEAGGTAAGRTIDVTHRADNSEAPAC